MLKIALLAPANSTHTIRWANGLNKKGLKVIVISAHSKDTSNIEFDKNVTLHILNYKAPLGYVLGVYELRKILKDFQPDLLNAHYATGYGLLANLSGFKPLLLSVWGSDIFNFPKKSFLHKWLLKNNLKNATAIASTSYVMADEVKKIYPHNKIFITPFGIDTSLFFPQNNNSNSDCLVIGTVKTLSHIYGIEYLIKAFALCLAKTTIPIKLEITGSGKDLPKLIKLCENLKITDKVVFNGFIAHNKIPDILNKIDIFVALSLEESFGVAVLEANACGKPVVVSNAPGLSEVVIDGVTGFIVPKEDYKSSADAIMKLVQDHTLRYNMGRNALTNVLEHYTWEKSIDLMVSSYNKLT